MLWHQAAWQSPGQHSCLHKDTWALLKSKSNRKCSGKFKPSRIWDLQWLIAKRQVAKKYKWAQNAPLSTLSLEAVLCRSEGRVPAVAFSGLCALGFLVSYWAFQSMRNPQVTCAGQDWQAVLWAVTLQRRGQASGWENPSPSIYHRQSLGISILFRPHTMWFSASEEQAELVNAEKQNSNGAALTLSRDGFILYL